jgi:hypothetical protein
LDTKIPGFTAKESLGKTRTSFQAVSKKYTSIENQRVIPQFIGRGIICAGLVAAVLAGQEELLPLAFTYCGRALA